MMKEKRNRDYERLSKEWVTIKQEHPETAKLLLEAAVVLKSFADAFGGSTTDDEDDQPVIEMVARVLDRADTERIHRIGNVRDCFRPPHAGGSEPTVEEAEACVQRKLHGA